MKKLFVLGLILALLLISLPVIADDGNTTVTGDVPQSNTTAPAPTETPTPEPTTVAPTATPTVEVTTVVPTETPTAEPTTVVPTATPTVEVTTVVPTETPTAEPTTVEPTLTPTPEPTQIVPLVPAKIWTDKADYWLGEIVTISGTGFTSDADVKVTILANDTVITELHVTTDSTGAFTTSYITLGHPLYDVTATDGTNTATTAFTDPTKPYLTLKIALTKDNGGTAQKNDWMLIATSGTTTLSDPGPSWSPAKEVTAGSTWALSTTGPNGYTLTNWVCIGGTQSGNQITIGSGDTPTCEISADDIPPSLTLVKEVSGGSSLPTVWTLSASGPTTISGSGGVSSGATFPKGTYTLSESGGPGGYSAGSWVCLGTGSQSGSQVTLDLAQSETCTIINTLTSTPPTITTQPGSQTITYGADVSFSAAASGTPAPALHWEISTDGGSTWNDISGSTSSPLAITTPPVSSSGNKYRAVFTNSGGSATSNAATLTVNKADATISVTPYDVTYDGDAHTATGSATGVKSEVLAGLVLTGTTHTDAGTYTDTWTFTDVTGNYNNDSDTVTDKIAQADATIDIAGWSGTYNGDAHGASITTATGVKGEDLSASVDLGASFTNVPGGTASWSFSNINYLPESGDVAIDISKANPTVNVIPYSVIYDHLSHTATGTVTGVKGESLSGLDLSGTTHTNPGTYTDTWTFTDVTGNYNNVGATTITDKIHYTVVGLGFLQPIDMDGGSIFKLGSTVPTKFQLKDSTGNYVSTAVAYLMITKISNNPEGDEIEAVSTSAATTGNLFRVADNQYIFNLGTKTSQYTLTPLAKGTYRITAYLDSGQTITVKISLK